MPFSSAHSRCCVVAIFFACHLLVPRAFSADFTAAQIAPTWEVYSYSPQEWSTKPVGYGFSAIVAMDGAIWVATEARGLWLYREGKWEDMNDKVQAPHVRMILKTKDGTLWFPYDIWGGQGGASSRSKTGVASYKDGVWKKYEMPDLIPGYAVELDRGYAAPDGSLWFIALGQIIRFQQGMWSLVRGVHQAQHLLPAADGTIWVTGDGDFPIWRSTGGDFAPVIGDGAIHFRYPNELVEAPDGAVWIGDYGLTVFSKGSYRRIEAKPQFDGNRIWPFFAASDGTVFVARAFDGVAAYRDGKWIVPDQQRGRVSGILEARDHSIWIGTNMGIYRYLKGTWTYYSVLTSEVSPNIDSFHEAADGSIWAAASEGGIARYVDGKWWPVQRTPHVDEPSVSKVAAWCNASDGSLWIGYKNGELRRFRASKGEFLATVNSSAVRTTLHVDSGRKDYRDWTIRYGFATSLNVPPVEVNTVSLDSSAETWIALKPSDNPVYLRGYAMDSDGTTINLRGEHSEEAIEIVGRSPQQVTTDSPELQLPAAEMPAGVSADFIVYIDGIPLRNDTVEFRGDSDGQTKVVVEKRPVFASLNDGFHELQVSAAGTLAKFVIYKDKQLLKLFRPFNRSVAVIVAISAYPTESGYRQLPNAEPQAKELADYLAQQGFEVKLVLGSSATSRQIDKLLLEELNLGPQDRLLFYFGGHGDSVEDFQKNPIGYLVPYDGQKQRLASTGIPLADLMGRYSLLIKAKHELFVLDSCQSGLATRDNPIDAAAIKTFKAYRDIAYYSNETGRAVLTAGTGGEAALDISGGIFTRAFLDGIKGHADRETGDGNGVVDFYELFTYIQNKVGAEALANHFDQHPDFYIAPQFGLGRFIFVNDKSLLQ
jgi:sugar lactone lactonase YvrE